ncbi:MAG: hypothetical protein KC931_06450 [Candidatus Omnitrophica bacterium]|nr:hypothetical protein [Candidatus Omnitrophota bacterium]
MMRKRSTIITAAIMLAFHCTLVAAQNLGPYIPFQGHLTQPVSGSPNEYEAVPDGQYDILFALYTSPVGGEGLVWGPERHKGLVVVNGLVNALLGSVDGFEAVLQSDPNFFKRILYVGITIDADNNPNTVDLELVPRQVLLPAIQSINSDQLDGADWRDFFVGTDSNATYSPGITKARDSDLWDGIDAGALVVDPNNKANPKVKIAASADSINGQLVLNDGLTVNGILNIAGELQGVVKNVSGEEGYLRIGDIQVCWGRYVSELTDNGAFEKTYIITPTTLPAAFVDSNYVVVAAPFSPSPSQPLTLPNRYSSMVYDMTPSQFEALTVDSDTNDPVLLDYINEPGFYIAIGRWR